MSLKQIIPFLILGLFFSCGPSKSDTVLNSLTNKDKATILNKKGVSMYKTMVDNGDLKSAPDVKNIFQQALEFDPKNSDSLSYIAKVDKFVSSFIDKYINAAKANMNKKKRTDADDYALCTTLQKAGTIDPNNKDLIVLKDSSKDIREKFAKKMQSSGDAALTASKTSKNKDAQEKQVFKAIQFYNMGLAASTGQDSSLNSKKSEAVGIISTKIDSMLSDARALVNSKKYKDADALARKIVPYNLAADHKYDDQIKKLQYDINFAWAGQLFDSGKLDAASDKIDAAVRYNKTDEAVALQAKIQEKKDKADIAASFPAWVENIDELISRMDFYTATQKINYIEARLKDEPRKAQLEARKKRMLGQVETLYKTAVDNFVNENYDDAVSQFQGVLAVSPGYKDSDNYLQEAKSKEKILKSY